MKSTISCSTQAVFDVSSIDWTKREQIHFPVPIEMQDTIATFNFYANGDEKASDGYVSGYITIKDISDHNFANDHRHVSLIFQCGDAVCDLNAKPIRTFIKGWGSNDLFLQTQAKKYGEITVCVRIDDGHDCQHLLDAAHKQRTQTLYELVRKMGDIELVPIHIVTEPSMSGKDETDSKDGDDHDNELNGDDHGGDYRENGDDGLCSIDEDERGIESIDHRKIVPVRMSSILLSNASPVFKRMLANDMKEAKEKQIRIPCSKTLTIDDLAFFIVTGQLSVDADAFDLVKVAHLYQMESLIWACLERLIHEITPETFVKVVTVFEEFNIVKDEVVESMYGKLLHYYHQHKHNTLKEVANGHSLPFCFTQWSRYVDHAHEYRREAEESDESEVDETELQEMFIAMEEID